MWKNQMPIHTWANARGCMRVFVWCNGCLLLLCMQYACIDVYCLVPVECTFKGHRDEERGLFVVSRSCHLVLVDCHLFTIPHLWSCVPFYAILPPSPSNQDHFVGSTSSFPFVHSKREWWQAVTFLLYTLPLAECSEMWPRCRRCDPWVNLVQVGVKLEPN